MAIAFPNTAGDISVVTNTSGTANTTITGTKPANTIVGDMLEVTVHAFNTANPLTITDNSGKLSVIASNTSGNGNFQVHTSIYRRIVDGTETTFPFTFSVGGTNDDVVIVRRVTGVNLSTPTGATSTFNSTSSAVPSNNTLTTTANNAAVRFIVSNRNGSLLAGVDSNNPSGTTMLKAAAVRASSASLAYGQAYQMYPTAGTVTGGKAWNNPSNFMTGSNYWSTVSYEIIPADNYTLGTTNGGASVKSGEATTTNTTGFLNVTSGTLGTTYPKALTGISWNSNVASYTAPIYVDGQTFPEPSTTQTLTLSDGTNSASSSVTFDPPTGSTSVVLSSPNTVNDHYIGYWLNSLGYTPLNNDRVVYVTADVTVYADTGVTTANPITTTIWYWRQSDGKIFSFNITINEAGAIVGIAPSGIPLSIGLGFGI